jgi:hypothetical protein
LLEAGRACDVANRKLNELSATDADPKPSSMRGLAIRDPCAKATKCEPVGIAADISGRDRVPARGVAAALLSSVELPFRLPKLAS